MRYTRKQSEATCMNCGITFLKAHSEYKRNKEFNRPNFCTRRCSGIYNLKNFGDKRNTSTEHLNPYNKVDEYTPFRYHFRNCKSRFKDFNLTLEDIMDVWNRQNGICPYTGILLHSSNYSRINKDPIYSASLDRVDSSKGYTKDNVQFVSRAINYMKNTMSHEDTIRLCKIIANHHNSL